MKKSVPPVVLCADEKPQTGANQFRTGTRLKSEFSLRWESLATAAQRILWKSSQSARNLVPGPGIVTHALSTMYSCSDDQDASLQ